MPTWYRKGSIRRSHLLYSDPFLLMTRKKLVSEPLTGSKEKMSHRYRSNLPKLLPCTNGATLQKKAKMISFSIDLRQFSSTRRGSREDSVYNRILIMLQICRTMPVALIGMMRRLFYTTKLMNFGPASATSCEMYSFSFGSGKNSNSSSKNLPTMCS